MGDSRAEWGVCVDVGRIFILDLCGPLHSSPLHSGFLGATQLSNNTAELVAILVACRWIAQQAVGSQVVLVYDSEYAANLVQRFWRPRSNFSIVLAARQIYDAARDVATIRWEHVDSHTGEFWNDRADVLAKHGATRDSPRSSNSAILASLRLA